MRNIGLNPLHCGAVVASWPKLNRMRRRWSSLNPLHCGAVVASERAERAGRRRARVLIPFIAGQWSLLDGSPDVTRAAFES